MYDLNPFFNASSVYGIAQFVNVISDDLFFTLLLVAIFFIGYMQLKRYAVADAMLVTSFAASFLGIILAYLQLVNFYVVIGFVLFFAFTMGEKMIHPA